jgi:DNA-binding NarL/FixJ family response regulator
LLLATFVISDTSKRGRYHADRRRLCHEQFFLEASRRIRARPWGSTILIAALTGWGQDVDRRRAQEAGVDLHFVKPVDTTALLSVVARSLNGDQLVDRSG